MHENTHSLIALLIIVCEKGDGLHTKIFLCCFLSTCKSAVKNYVAYSHFYSKIQEASSSCQRTDTFQMKASLHVTFPQVHCFCNFIILLPLISFEIAEPKKCCFRYINFGKNLVCFEPAMQPTPCCYSTES